MGDRKLAVVTGVSRGIGLHVAKRLIDSNRWHVVAVGKSEEAIRSNFFKGGYGWLTCFEGDVKDPKIGDELVSFILQEKGNSAEIHALVNNAGVLTSGLLRMTTDEQITTLMETNLLAPIRITRSLLRRMAHDASLVFVSSISATKGLPGVSVYAASKGGLIGFVKALAKDHPNLRVNAIAPAVVDTALIQSISPSIRQDLVEAMRQGALTPDEVGSAIMWMIEQPKLTGQVIELDGAMRGL